VHAAERGQADPTAGGDRREEGNAHLEVDEREGEGLERVVVAEEGSQPRPDSEQRRRAAGHHEPPGEPGRGARVGAWSGGLSRGGGGAGEEESGEESRRGFASRGRGGGGGEICPPGAGGWFFSVNRRGRDGRCLEACLICFGKSLSLLYLFIYFKKIKTK